VMSATTNRVEVPPTSAPITKLLTSIFLRHRFEACNGRMLQVCAFSGPDSEESGHSALWCGLDQRGRARYAAGKRFSSGAPIPPSRSGL
jgi:hypothetical protein